MDGECCKNGIALVELADVRRIVTSKGLRPARFVRLYAAGEIEDLVAREGEEVWVETTQGARVMGLRRRHDQCIFLTADNRCRIYSARPLNCQIYPIDYIYGRQHTRIIVRRDQWCKGKCTGELDPQKLLALADRLNAACAETIRFVERWNRRTEGRAKPTDFYEHLAAHVSRQLSVGSCQLTTHS